jgi:hypothetical protein
LGKNIIRRREKGGKCKRKREKGKKEERGKKMRKGK